MFETAFGGGAGWQPAVSPTRSRLGVRTSQPLRIAMHDHDFACHHFADRPGFSLIEADAVVEYGSPVGEAHLALQLLGNDVRKAAGLAGQARAGPDRAAPHDRRRRRSTRIVSTMVSAPAGRTRREILLGGRLDARLSRDQRFRGADR